MNYGQSMYVDLELVYYSDDRNPRQFMLNCNYDYDADDTIVNVYITIDDKTLYTRVPEYDNTLMIDVSDTYHDFNRNQA
ncbi:unnamed protein product [Medioppia subpectinata]|uniref:Uncharacterized protein n=1 Tax=Medioppia subpectinata TaxID=1979941 RepID=A0A7R9PWJ4_9ACAR|nr:unnamed protein product [Medioppia subpectinata]CAG2103401.1 unnamed protein product [Medioppia subpectinata]